MNNDNDNNNYNGSIICLVSSHLFLIASMLNYLFDKHISHQYYIIIMVIYLYMYTIVK